MFCCFEFIFSVNTQLKLATTKLMYACNNEITREMTSVVSDFAGATCIEYATAVDSSCSGACTVDRL